MTELESYFSYRCWTGLSELGHSEKQNYRDRLQYEIEAISRAGFCGYLLLVSDILKWARDNGILCSPARGSAAGSLCVNCLGISHPILDPVKYNLLFERFINPDRIAGLPDIDSDVEDVKRDQLIDYLKSKYEIAHIGTYGTLKTRAAVREATRVLGYPYDMGDKLCKLLLPPISGKPQDFETCYKQTPELRTLRDSDSPEGKILQLAGKLENQIKSFGTHAAGIIISDKPISEYLPLYPGKDKKLTSQFDMGGVEAVGLVKFDFLGIRALTTIQKCIELTGVDINSIPIDDENTYRMLCEGDTLGVFQLTGSSGIRDLTVQIKPRNLEDLSLLTSLFRPGPIASGMLSQVVGVRNGSFEPTYLVPELEPILRETAGVVCYQEDAMRIARELAGYTPSEADILRKIIGKKQSEKMPQQRDKFISGMVQKGFQRAKATELFEQIEGFASYSFNKCLVGKTQVKTTEGKNIEIGNLKAGQKLAAFDVTKQEIYEDVCEEIIDCGEGDVWELTLEDNSKIECTINHKFLCSDMKKHPLWEIRTKNLPLVSIKENKVSHLKLKLAQYLRRGQVFNLRMRGENHNFLLSNGVVSGNSHSLSYSLISYWMAYLKCHHPTEFICACLTTESDNQEEISKYVNYCRTNGIQIKPPSINKSEEAFSIRENTIRFGLSAIKNIGVSAREIITERQKSPFGSFRDFCERINTSKINRKKVDSLILSGTFDEFGIPRSGLLEEADNYWQFNKTLLSYESKLETYQKKLKMYLQRQRETEEYNQLENKKGVKKPGKMKEPTEPERPIAPVRKSTEELPEIEKLNYERDLLSCYVSGHPLDSVVTHGKTIEDIRENGLDKQKVNLTAIPVSVEEKTTKKKTRMASLILEDTTGTIEAVIWPGNWEKIKLEKGKPYNLTLSLDVIQTDETRIVKGSVIRATVAPIVEKTITIPHLFIDLSDAIKLTTGAKQIDLTVRTSKYYVDFGTIRSNE